MIGAPHCSWHKGMAAYLSNTLENTEGMCNSETTAVTAAATTI